jgi:hypothetical protein
MQLIQMFKSRGLSHLLKSAAKNWLTRMANMGEGNSRGTCCEMRNCQAHNSCPQIQRPQRRWNFSLSAGLFMSATSAPLATIAVASTVDPLASAPQIWWQAAIAGKGLKAEGGITAQIYFKKYSWRKQCLLATNTLGIWLQARRTSSGLAQRRAAQNGLLDSQRRTFWSCDHHFFLLYILRTKAAP